MNETSDNTVTSTEQNTTATTPTQERMAGVGSPSLAQGESFFVNAIIAFGLLAIPLVLLVLYYKTMFFGLANNAAMDYAQLGKNLADGRGFTTFYIRPLALTHGDNLMNQPDLINSPLFPFLLALSFGARGATDASAVQVSGLFYLLTVPVLYLLGCRVFSRNVALLAVAVYAANPLMLEYATSGMPVTLQAFLMTCLLLLMHQFLVRIQGRADDPQRPIPHAQLVGIGALTGALYLTDSSMFPLIPVMVLAVFSILRANNSIRAITSFAVPLVLLILPWMFRLGRLTGNPIYGLRGMEIWMGTKGFYMGGLAYRTMPADLVPGPGLFQAVVRKIVLGVGEIIQTFPQVSASWMLAFLLPSLLFRFRDTATNSLRTIMMYCFLATMLGMLPFGVDMPLFAPLIPIMLVFAIAYLLRLLDQSNPPKSTRILLASLLAVSVVLPLLRGTILSDKPTPTDGVKTAQALKKVAGQNDAFLTDQPWLVAWYANRPAVWIPNTDSNITAYRERFKGLRWLFLTDQTTGFSPEWQNAYNAFYQWNVECLRIQVNNLDPKAIKQDIQTVGVSANEQIPLTKILEGFYTVEPIENNPVKRHTSTVALAAIPVNK
ncbi:MAG: glycosyltransferase family 39 protein [Armatimonas sp.]